MSIRMRIGRWHERSGNEAIVIARSLPFPIDGKWYRWCGFDSRGMSQMYTDGGECYGDAGGQDQPHSLLTYVGPVGATEGSSTPQEAAAWLLATQEKRQREFASMN